MKINHFSAINHPLARIVGISLLAILTIATGTTVATTAYAAPDELIVLDTPTLISPANSSTTADSTPNFDWGDVTIADEYQIQVDNNTDFSSPEIDVTVTSSAYSVTSFLTNGTYSWRVRATNVLDDWSDWSTPRTVTIADDNRLDISFNTAWRFNRADVAGAQAVGFDDSAWTLLSLPHTWNNLDGQDGGNNYYRGIGWYRRHFTIPSDYTGKRIFIRFEAVSKAADVYVNGTLVGQHEGAFAAFVFDITSLVSIGADNVIAVKANNSASLIIAPLSGDFNQDGGIFRPVHLLVTDKVHVTPLDYGSPGVYLTPTNVSASSADLQAAVKVDNNSSTQETVSVQTTIRDADGTDVATMTSTQDMAASSSVTFVQNTTLANPHLWNGRSDPYLYQAVIKVRLGDTVVDEVAQPLGFRYFHLDPNTGFTLNGNPLDLHGVAMHEGRPNKGRAISDADRAEDIGLIMEMGATFVRLAHYQHAETTYDLSDENGLVVWTEVPLVNSASSSTAFTDNAKQQLRELIRQNYNHPSVFFWGLYNEVGVSSTNLNLVAALNVVAHEEDTTRPTTGANLNSIPPSTSLPTDITAWNLYYGWYSETLSVVTTRINNFHTYHPYMGVSEYGAGGSINHHEDNATAPITTGLWHPEEYQNIFHESYWKQMSALPFLWNKTIWVAFDFAVDSRNEGDTPGRNDKGMITFDRSVKKDSFYWYKANWSDEPLVYITSRRFTFRDNNVVEVKVYSNCDSVELLLNGVSRGSLTSADHIYRWTNVLLAPGNNTVRAVCTLGAEQHEDVVMWDTGPALTPLPVGLHQETDSRIVYTGTWTNYTGPEPNGGSTRLTNQRNAVARFDFKGTGLNLYRTKGSNRGLMQVCVDGDCQTINNSNSTTLWNQMVTIKSGLTNGVHRAVIRNVSTSTSINTIDLDAVEVIGPPEVPTLVSPTDGSTIVNSMPNFDWGDVAGATQYQLEVDDNADFTGPVVVTMSLSSYMFPSPLSNGTYYWRVRASNGLWSDYSSVWAVTIAVPAPIPVLTAPIDGSTIAISTPDFDWEDVAGATQYQIQVSDVSDFNNLILEVETALSSYTSVVLLSNGVYYWRVRASNGVWSEYSGSWTVTIAVPPAVPPLTSPDDGSTIANGTPDFEWEDVAGATQYHIQVADAPDFDNLVLEVDTTLSSYTPDLALLNGTYHWRVRASNGVWSDYSGSWMVTIAVPPAVPALSSPDDGSTTADGTPDFSWEVVAGATEYHIQVADIPDFNSLVFEIDTTTSSYTPAVALPNGTYYWRVRAGNGVWSAYSSPWAVTIAVPPAAPSGLTAAPISRTRIDLAWVDNSNDEIGFKIQRSVAGAGIWALIATTKANVILYSDTTVACSTAYDYRVIAANAASDSAPSNTASATTAACLTGIPKAPKITLPATTFLTNDDTPDFAWTKVTNAATYHIQISLNSRFTRIVQENPVDETAVYTASHLDDGVYYVRVQGVNSLGVRGKWSATRKITIDTTSPPAPMFKKPLDGVLTKSTRPMLIVIKSPGAVQYQFQLSSSAGFGSTLVDVIKKTTSYKVPASLGLVHGATYYWRVAAIDKAGNISEWSTIWRFSITP